MTRMGTNRYLQKSPLRVPANNSTIRAFQVTVQFAFPAPVDSHTHFLTTSDDGSNFAALTKVFYGFVTQL